MEKEDKKKKKELGLEEKLKECEKQKKEYLEGWQRARADLINYKREEMKRMEKLARETREKMILEILPILDNFDAAQKALPEGLKNNENVRGMLLIKKQMLELLKRYGVNEIECLGKEFDPRFEEVVEEVETEDKEGGIVVEEIQKGYKINDSVLRPAKVKISKKVEKIINQ